MDYFGIIKRAYHFTLKHKFLWIFGIFAGAASGVTSFKTSTPNYILNTQDIDKYLSSTSSGNLDQFWASYGVLVLTILGGVLLISIIFFILNIISQGALIGLVARINKQEKVHFSIGFGIGWHQFWRVWATMLVFLLMILVSLCLVIIPASILVILNLYVLAAIWGILLFFISLLFWILIAVISPYSLRVVVLEKKSVWESIRESLHFIRKNLAEVLVVYLLLIAVNIVFGIALVLAFLLASGILFMIGYGLWLASSALAIGYGIVIGLAFLTGLVVISGMYSSFYSGVLTLTYEKLKSK